MMVLHHMCVYILVVAIVLVDGRQQADALRVVTYNLGNYNDHGRWELRRDIIADQLVALDADVVLMQETRYDPDEATSAISYQDMAQQILFRMNELGHYRDAHLVTQPSMYYSRSSSKGVELASDEYVNPYANGTFLGEARLWEGSSIVSKSRILETGTAFLTKTSGCTDSNLRSTQFISIHLNDDESIPLYEIPESEKLYLFNTHFGLAGECLRENVLETLNFMKPHDQDAKALLAGDFNALPTDPLIDPLRQIGMVDEWVALHPNDDGFTCCTNIGDPPAFHKRIDYFWTNYLLSQYAVDIEIMGDVSVNDTLGSDHYGIVLDFKF